MMDYGGLFVLLLPVLLGFSCVVACRLRRILVDEDGRQRSRLRDASECILSCLCPMVVCCSQVCQHLCSARERRANGGSYARVRKGAFFDAGDDAYHEEPWSARARDDLTQAIPLSACTGGTLQTAQLLNREASEMADDVAASHVNLSDVMTLGPFNLALCARSSGMPPTTIPRPPPVEPTLPAPVEPTRQALVEPRMASTLPAWPPAQPPLLPPPQSLPMLTQPVLETRDRIEQVAPQPATAYAESVAMTLAPPLGLQQVMWRGAPRVHVPTDRVEVPFDAPAETLPQPVPTPPAVPTPSLPPPTANVPELAPALAPEPLAEPSESSEISRQARDEPVREDLSSVDSLDVMSARIQARQARRAAQAQAAAVAPRAIEPIPPPPTIEPPRPYVAEAPPPTVAAPIESSSFWSLSQLTMPLQDALASRADPPPPQPPPPKPPAKPLLPKLEPPPPPPAPVSVPPSQETQIVSLADLSGQNAIVLQQRAGPAPQPPPVPAPQLLQANAETHSQEPVKVVSLGDLAGQPLPAHGSGT